jgi:hypothetical protein
MGISTALVSREHRNVQLVSVAFHFLEVFTVAQSAADCADLQGEFLLGAVEVNAPLVVITDYGDKSFLGITSFMVSHFILLVLGAKTFWITLS